MSSFEQYLEKIQELTNQNLELLQLINDSLYTNANSVSATINNTIYTIPSFLFLESKINDLEGNWRRLVNSPKSGEAAFVMDGAVNKIVLNGFDNAPAPISFDLPSEYGVESNNIFKDFISPLLYLKFDISEVEDYINKVNVRKVSILNKTLETLVSEVVDSEGKISWSDLYAKLVLYKKDVDYVLYDKVYDLPIRKPDSWSEFKIVSDPVSYTKNNKIYWSIQLEKNDYKYDDGTLTGTLSVGDQLVTSNSSNKSNCKLEIVSIDGNKYECEVISGYETITTDNTTLIYVKDVLPEEKYIKVPLEEDKYVVVFISPINSMNVQSEWGKGVYITTDSLKNGDTSFSEEYTKVKNIGDALYDLVQFASAPLSNIGSDKLSELVSYIPLPITNDTEDANNGNKYDVILLNDHLLDNASIEEIRKLNNQKAEINSKLSTTQQLIDEITSTLSTTDMSSQNISVRTSLQSRLDALNVEKTTYTNSLINIINQITYKSGNALLPTSGSKYVIRGAIDTDKIESEVSSANAKVIKIDILYRYKNVNKKTSNATSISDFITVGNWNKYISNTRQKVAKTSDSSYMLSYELEPTVGSDNTAADWRVFNIPITQGETVDVKYRIQYDLGYPYVSVFSDWSETVNVVFPDELITNTDITSTINDNETDSRNAVIKSELINAGVTSHIEDRLIDQDLTYYHRPESIASGFYTEDTRRIISLKEKLYEISNEINSMKIYGFGNNYKNIDVVISDSSQSVLLSPNSDTNSISINFNEMSESSELFVDNSIEVKNRILNIVISNPSNEYPIYLYSMFPGAKTVSLKDSTTYQSKWKTDGYDIAHDIIKVANNITLSGKDESTSRIPQLRNQVLYFRQKKLFTDATINTLKIVDDKDSYNKVFVTGKATSCVYPYISDISGIQPESETPGSYIMLAPGSAIQVPLVVLAKELDNKNDNYKPFTVSFDLWNSPFQDPLNYTVTINIVKDNTSIKKITEATENSQYSVVINKPKKYFRHTAPALNKPSSLL